MSAAVRPCTVSAAAPAPSTACATSIAVICSRVQPSRIFAVTGVGRQAATTCSIIAPIRSGSRSKYEPLCAFCTTSRTGQPKLISTTLTWYSCASRAPTLASVSGSLSQICTASGRGSSATPHKRSGCSASCSASQTKPLALTISVAKQACAAELAHDLAEGVVRVARHRGLQDRRIDPKWTDPKSRHWAEYRKRARRIVSSFVARCFSAKMTRGGERTHSTLASRVESRRVKSQQRTHRVIPCRSTLDP